MNHKNRRRLYSRVALLMTVLMFISTGNTFAQSFKVTGNSMYPTLKDGDIVDVASDSEYEKGDMVIAKLKTGKYVVKRYEVDRLVGDNKGGSINVPMSDVDSILGKATENQETLTEEETKAFQEVFAFGIKRVASGFSSSAALTNLGEVYTWGSNDYGQLGIGNEVSKLSPVKIQNLKDIVEIDFAWRNGAAINADGELYTWGINNYGQLGAGERTHSNVPIKVDFPGKVKHVSIGDSFILILDEFGDVYACGNNTSYQLGIPDTSARKTPTKVIIPSGEKIVQVSAGNGFSAALSESGEVFTWGKNEKGQGGNGTTVSTISSPLKISFPDDASKIKQIEAGGVHMAALSESGKVYTWGNNDKFQLGFSGGSKEPRLLVEMDKPVIKIAAGEFTTFFITEGKELYGAGTNVSGELGMGSSVEYVSKIVKPDLPEKTMDVSAGYNHVLSVTDSGIVHGWGSDSSGQLGDVLSGYIARSPQQLNFNEESFKYSLFSVSGVIYLATGDDIPKGFKSINEDIITAVVEDYNITLNVMRYKKPKSVGDLIIE